MGVRRRGLKSYVNETGLHVYIRELVHDEVIYPFYVTRTYITKHGNGYLADECDRTSINPMILDATNQPNPYQGTLRYAQFTDESANELLNRIRRDAEGYPYKIVVTHCNEHWTDLLSFADYKSFNEIEFN